MFRYEGSYTIRATENMRISIKKKKMFELNTTAQTNNAKWEHTSEPPSTRRHQRCQLSGAVAHRMRANQQLSCARNIGSNEWNGNATEFTPSLIQFFTAAKTSRVISLRSLHLLLIYYYYYILWEVTWADYWLSTPCHARLPININNKTRFISEFIFLNLLPVNYTHQFGSASSASHTHTHA